MKKEIIVAYFRLLFRYLIWGGTVQHIDTVAGRDSKRKPSRVQDKRVEQLDTQGREVN
jgi:hypothetical protein